MMEPVPEYYDVDGMKRILALSIGKFDRLSPLPNSMCDKGLILRTFSKLGFRPTQEKDDTLTALDATKLITKFCQKFSEGKEKNDPLKRMKCLAVYLKSHGGLDATRGTFMNFKDQQIPVWDLLEPLLNHELLKGVPKIVIFEGCRGTNSIYRRAGDQTPEIKPPTAGVKIHRRVDTIFFAASPESEYAYTVTDPEKPSPFTEAFCEELDQNPSIDVYDLSNRIVARLKDQPISLDNEPIEYLMAPCTETSLTKRLRLYNVREKQDTKRYMPAGGTPPSGAIESQREEIRFLRAEREKLILENQNLQLDLNHARNRK